MTSDNDIRALAREFSRQLFLGIPGDMGDVVALNRKEGFNGVVCHTHDFCDANQVMLDAFAAVFNREPVLDDADDYVLVSKSWTVAKRCDFGITCRGNFDVSLVQH